MNLQEKNSRTLEMDCGILGNRPQNHERWIMEPWKMDQGTLRVEREKSHS